MQSPNPTIVEDNDEAISSNVTSSVAYSDAGARTQRGYVGTSYQFNYSGSGSLNVHYGDHLNFYSKQDAQRSKERLLQSLRYPEMNARYNEIAIHAEKTFEWVFETTNLEIGGTLKQHLTDMSISYNNIAKWLRKGSDIYLILGKPGGGKSTFMKFLSKDLRVRDALREWSNGSEVLLLFHSFWGLSKRPPAHNWKGFLASLTYQLISKIPDVISSTQIDISLKFEYDDWSPEDLQNLLLQGLKSSAQACCLLVDALDEAEASQIRQIFAWIRNLTNKMGDRCKVCLASRRLSCLEPSSVAGWMELDRFTPADLKIYITERLQYIMNDLPDVDPDAERKQLDDFVVTMCHQAKGIWIWVYHVLKNLENEVDFSGNIDWSQLKKEIEILPQDVHDLYRHSLARAKTKWPRKERERSVLLSIGQHSLPLFQALMTVDDERRNRYLERRTSENDDQSLAKWCDIFKKQVYELSGCLLESSSNHNLLPGYLGNVELAIGIATGTDLHLLPPENRLTWLVGPLETQSWRTESVQYIHRTVYEFLSREGEISEDPWRLLWGSQLVCHIESVVALTSAELVRMHWWVAREAAPHHAVTTINQICQSLVTTRLANSMKPLAQTPLLSISDETWFYSLRRRRTEIFSALDYAGFLFALNCETINTYLLDQYVGGWGSYYKGYLVCCVINNMNVTIAGTLNRERIDILQKLQQNGADLENRLVSVCSDSLRIYWLQSSVSRLLSLALEQWLKLPWQNVWDERKHGSLQWVYKQTQCIIQLLAHYDLKAATVGLFRSVRCRFSCRNGHHESVEDIEAWDDSWNDRWKLFHQSDCYVWDHSMTMVTFNANDILMFLKRISSIAEQDFATPEVFKNKLKSQLMGLSSTAHLSLLDLQKNDSRWIECPKNDKDIFVTAGLFDSDEAYVTTGLTIIRRAMKDLYTIPMLSTLDCIVRVPPEVRPIPLDKHAEVVDGDWKAVCSLREYYRSLQDEQVED